jgi:tetratricopeptide (TPR) repeat protein
LQSHAPPGGVLVGDVTRRAAGDLFAWSEERRLELKGKAGAVSAFEVIGEGRATRRAIASTPMVGRERELERATEVAERALGGEGGLLFVVGEPGIGKTRLVDEMHGRLSGTAVTWLEGRCVSFGGSTPYLPLRDVVLDALGLQRDEPVPRSVLAERLRTILPGDLDDAVPFVEAMLGAVGDEETRPSPETLRLRVLDALRRLVVAIGERGPAVIAIEDLHWADASTLEALELLVPASRDRALLFVLTTRHDDEGTVGALARGVPDRAEAIELAALPHDRIDELADALLEGEAIPPELLGRVAETAGGNPFFLSELIRSLAGSGALVRDGSTSVTPGNEPMYLVTLGRAYRGRGDYDEALAVGRGAFDLARELGHGEWTGWAAAWLGATLMELDAFAEAAELLEQGAEAAERSDAGLHLVRCLGTGAWAAERLGEHDRAVMLADRAAAILDRIRVRPPRAWVAGYDAYVGVARVRLAIGEPELAEALVSPIVAACRACGWSDGVVDGSLVLAEAALRRGTSAVAVVAAEHALEEALRTDLPTVWRAHRAVAEAYRAAGDEQRGTEHADEAERGFAQLIERIHDRVIREALVSAATSGPSSGGVER